MQTRQLHLSEVMIQKSINIERCFPNGVWVASAANRWRLHPKSFSEKRSPKYYQQVSSFWSCRSPGVPGTELPQSGLGVAIHSWVNPSKTWGHFSLWGRRQKQWSNSTWDGPFMAWTGEPWSIWNSQADTLFHPQLGQLGQLWRILFLLLEMSLWPDAIVKAKSSLLCLLFKDTPKVIKKLPAPFKRLAFSSENAFTSKVKWFWCIHLQFYKFRLCKAFFYYIII